MDGANHSYEVALGEAARGVARSIMASRTADGLADEAKVFAAIRHELEMFAHAILDQASRESRWHDLVSHEREWRE
jgi:hypothetical protein